MDPLEKAIQDHWARKARWVGARAEVSEPDADDFYRFLSGRMDADEVERMESFICEHAWAQELILEAREMIALPPGGREVPPAWLSQANSLKKSKSLVCPHCQKTITPFKGPLAAQQRLNAIWLVLAVASFAGSFLVPRYFMQFLALTVIFGFRWVWESRAIKTQILVYRALKEDAEHSHPDSEVARRS